MAEDNSTKFNRTFEKGKKPEGDKQAGTLGIKLIYAPRNFSKYTQIDDEFEINQNQVINKRTNEIIPIDREAIIGRWSKERKNHIII